jgi:hypothetical protein
MTEYQLQRAIARRTGEDRETIAARGFHLVDDELSDEDLAPYLDWDLFAAQAAPTHRTTSAVRV